MARPSAPSYKIRRPPAPLCVRGFYTFCIHNLWKTAQIRRQLPLRCLQSTLDRRSKRPANNVDEPEQGNIQISDAYPRTGGYMRRLIDLRREPDGAAVGWMEDDFHHFGVTIEHDGETISDVRVISARFPFSTCPFAGANLQGMIGQPISRRSTDIGAMVPMREQCTHMFDLAGLAMAHAASSRQHRRYEAIVLDREIVAWEAGLRRLLGPGVAWLLRDGEEVLRWHVDRREITAPTEWAGQSMIKDFRARTEAMDIDDAEAATVLRRTVMIASGRTLDPDRFNTARERGQSGVCYTFLEENRDEASVMHGAAKNYEAGSEGMLSRIDERP